MYADKFQTFVLATDPAATTTKALPMAQYNLGDQLPILDAQAGFTTPKDTSGMASYVVNRLWVYCGAGEEIEDGFTLTLQHADQQSGPFTDLMTYGPTTVTKEPGDTVLQFPVPTEVKNWVRFVLSDALKVNIFYTPDIDKEINGLRR